MPQQQEQILKTLADDVVLDEQTARRLQRYARAIGKPVGETVAALLTDLLQDQDFWDAAEDPVGVEPMPPDKLN